MNYKFLSWLAFILAISPIIITILASLVIALMKPYPNFLVSFMYSGLFVLLIALVLSIFVEIPALVLSIITITKNKENKIMNIMTMIISILLIIISIYFWVISKGNIFGGFRFL